MDQKFLYMLALCACAAAFPRDKRSAESNSSSSSSSSSEESIEITTTTKPIESKIILIKDFADLETRISQAGDNLVIIFFMTTWCPFCKKITPTIEDVAAKTENLIVLKVDRDDLEENDNAAAWKYGLSKLPSVPRFIFIKNGQKVEEIHGSDADLRGTVTRVMSPNYDPDDSSDSSEEQ